MDTYGLPLTSQGGNGEGIFSKRVEIVVKKLKNSHLTQSEAVYVYKSLTKCISNAVRFGKKMIKKRGLADLKMWSTSLNYLLSIGNLKKSTGVINEKRNHQK
ncbi:hypothetical protein QMS56_09480 [Cronobacter malonaticus]|uniref:Uncharacterized protein n=3 Tax=Cronobacter malonaticus TaxID=413503 RepID=V5TXM3_9ENTR|nr:hypothetical protein [Cronobacter malonaticus]CCJ93793.1 hypothetical protein BN131_1466 [Cronobacter malonaticus 681]AHB69309.1 hypothetical protein P262_01329 [Cronobacter malonaticus]MDI6470034.1 hypothetical protein [Cronobacter malonaticus]MDI7594180.1 hypothetical protein [Cronobacter malonaticus]MDI7686335.1 hypothetical protein [Cronobacter malonaticus]